MKPLDLIAAAAARKDALLHDPDLRRAYERAGAPQVRYSQPRGVGTARSLHFPARMTAREEEKYGQRWYRLSGHASVTEVPYEMWDEFGPYNEVVAGTGFDVTLAADPDVTYLVNHRGLSMARTRPLDKPTLVLATDSKGLDTDAWLNPKRSDVQDLVTAVTDGNVSEMSFAFMLVAGSWSDDFTEYRITEVDLNRGDVSAVNYGANPYTDVSARQREIMADVDRLPLGAARAAAARLSVRLSGPAKAPVRAVDGRTAAQALRSTSAPGLYGRRLEDRLVRTAGRLIDHAHARDLAVADLPTARLGWYEIRNVDGDGEEPDVATVLLFDEIGGSMGVSARKFVDDIEAITAPVIKLRINSPGGSVRDAIAMHSALLHHPARIDGYVDSLAASAASIVAMAADELTMMPGSEMMIHDASMMSDGTAEDMRKAAVFLDRHSDNAADLYARRAGGTREQWRELMLAETWMFGEEAVELGLATRVSEEWTVDGPDDETMRRSHDVGQYGYRYRGRQEAPAPWRRLANGAVQFARHGANPAPVQGAGRSIAHIRALLDAETPREAGDPGR